MLNAGRRRFLCVAGSIVTNRICDISVQDSRDVCNDVRIILFHAVFDPVKHDSDEAVFVKICDKCFLFLCDGCLCGFFFNNTGDQRAGELKEIIFDPFPADTAVGI